MQRFRIVLYNKDLIILLLAVFIAVSNEFNRRQGCDWSTMRNDLLRNPSVTLRRLAKSVQL